MSQTGTAGTSWRKSSYSGGDNNCVEVAKTGSHVAVRDTKQPLGGVLSFTPGAWDTFTAAVRRP